MISKNKIEKIKRQLKEGFTCYHEIAHEVLNKSERKNRDINLGDIEDISYSLRGILFRMMENKKAGKVYLHELKSITEKQAVDMYNRLSQPTNTASFKEFLQSVYEDIGDGLEDKSYYKMAHANLSSNDQIVYDCAQELKRESYVLVSFNKETGFSPYRFVKYLEARDKGLKIVS